MQGELFYASVAAVTVMRQKCRQSALHSFAQRYHTLNTPLITISMRMLGSIQEIHAAGHVAHCNAQGGMQPRGYRVRSMHEDATIVHAPICSTCMRAQCNFVSGKDAAQRHSAKAPTDHSHRRVHGPLTKKWPVQYRTGRPKNGALSGGWCLRPRHVPHFPIHTLFNQSLQHNLHLQN